MKSLQSKSGGHAALRYTIDLLQAENLTRIVKTRDSQVMIDVGAKFGS